jgi:Ca2+-transporting ATPase
MTHKGFHAYSASVESTTAELGTNLNTGLSSSEAALRLQQAGSNQLVFSEGRSNWRILSGQFSSIVVWLLAIAAGVAMLTGSPEEAVAIIAVLILNASIGFLIEWQAGRALQALRRTSSTTARVKRDGREEVIDASELVIGDIIRLESGARVPCDARLVESVNLRADESTLTGESAEIDKSTLPVVDGSPLAERTSMVFLGTSILAGRGVAVVTATGQDTELGRVGKLLQTATQKQTPLERRLAELGRRLVYLILGISVIILAAGLIRGDEPWLMAKVAISLAVAAVPEGLPAVTTMILALGVLRMAKSSALVRRLTAVETLGSTTVICTDKTGTLTENRMKVREIVLSTGRALRIGRDRTEQGAEDETLDRLLRAAVLCNDAVSRAEKEKFVGDPTETALLGIAADLGYDFQHERSAFKRVFEIPFEASTKKMTVVSEAHEAFLATIKGGPSVVLEACDSFIDEHSRSQALDTALRDRFHEVNNRMAREGLRVLGFAEKSTADLDDDFEHGYTFLGFVGMADPPRSEVPEAIRMAKQAGIRIVMLTGDQVLTAEAIARELNLTHDHDIFSLHSRDLAGVEEARLAELASSAHVFARVTPEDKLRIVRALQAAGEVVAVTGDGVNDAPALKQADIGVAMGLRGTEVAKESADIILTDDNFSTIVKAVEGGRTIYANIIKFVHLMFSHNLGEILVIFGAMILSLPLPLLPLQILWVNLVTDIFPAFALAVEPSTKETMRRRPRSPKESFLSGGFMFLIAWQGAMLAAVTLGAYIWALKTYGEGGHARTVALLALVGVQIGHLFNCRSRTRSTFDRFFSNPLIFVSTAIVVGLQLLAIYNPLLSRVLQIEEPNSMDLLVTCIAIVLPVAIVEVSKIISRRTPE